MTEAKDWAGELISGQTTTGRILVSPIWHLYRMITPLLCSSHRLTVFVSLAACRRVMCKVSLPNPCRKTNFYSGSFSAFACRFRI
jgi:hypothetical protein